MEVQHVFLFTVTTHWIVILQPFHKSWLRIALLWISIVQIITGKMETVFQYFESLHTSQFQWYIVMFLRATVESSFPMLEELNWLIVNLLETRAHPSLPLTALSQFLAPPVFVNNTALYTQCFQLMRKKWWHSQLAFFLFVFAVLEYPQHKSVDKIIHIFANIINFQFKRIFRNFSFH